MKVTMGGLEVPFAADVHVGKLLIKMHETVDNEDKDSDDEDILNNKDHDKGGKKRKRKRGKAE